MATVAKLKAGLTSTRAALIAVKASGTVLGNPRLCAGSPEQARVRTANVLPQLDAAHPTGARILHELAEALTDCGVPTPASKGEWRLGQGRRVQAYRK